MSVPINDAAYIADKMRYTEHREIDKYNAFVHDFQVRVEISGVCLSTFIVSMALCIVMAVHTDYFIVLICWISLVVIEIGMYFVNAVLPFIAMEL